LTIKAYLIFGKRFTVFKTVNRFSKLNFWSLHACLISDCCNPAMVSCQNPCGTGIRQHLATGILTALESSDIQPPSPDVGEPNSSRNWPESGHGQKPAGSGQNVWNPAWFDRIWRSLAGIRPSLLIEIQQLRPNVAGFWQQLHFLIL
jgi:hypothetical protein